MIARTFAALAALTLAAPAAGPFEMVLPTDNDALFRGRPEEFYMFVDRTFRGEKTSPWEAGQYGFVRDPREVAGGIVFKRFHEGVDIKPVRRDGKGIPLDDVRAIGDGRVMHASLLPGASNYGRFVVIEHRWPGGPFYSLYAHLASIGVKPGDAVRAGDTIGKLGWSGTGIDLRRAHLHLELNVLLHSNFEEWHARHFPHDPNRHGAFNGLNLAGMDIAGFFLARRAAPGMTVPEFVAKSGVIFRVALPAEADFELPKRYPWMLADRGAKPAAWEIAFTGGGFPVSIRAFGEAVAEPRATWVQKSAFPPAYITRGLLEGEASSPRLSASGKRLMDLLAPGR